MLGPAGPPAWQGRRATPARRARAGRRPAGLLVPATPVRVPPPGLPPPVRVMASQWSQRTRRGSPAALGVAAASPDSAAALGLPSVLGFARPTVGMSDGGYGMMGLACSDGLTGSGLDVRASNIYCLIVYLQLACVV